MDTLRATLPYQVTQRSKKLLLVYQDIVSRMTSIHQMLPSTSLLHSLHGSDYLLMLIPQQERFAKDSRHHLFSTKYNISAYTLKLRETRLE